VQGIAEPEIFWTKSRVFPVANPIPQFIRLRDILGSSFGFAEAVILAAEIGVSHRKFRVDLDGPLQQ
jgi:hypothetical protein